MVRTISIQNAGEALATLDAVAVRLAPPYSIANGIDALDRW